MKKDIQEEIKRESSLSKEAKTNNRKNKSQDIVKIDPMELPTAIGEKEEKDFQRVDWTNKVIYSQTFFLILKSNTNL